MARCASLRPAVLVALALTSMGAAAFASAPVDPGVYAGLRWRLVGPFRGGRTVAAAGVPQRPGVFYIGVNNGGVWKTTDYGRVWTPIFDDQPTGSIGALAVAPSNPDIVYVGSGEGLLRPDLSTGDGVYKSLDGGASWTHLGLRDAQQIAQLAVDPIDPQRVFAAVLGHPYGANAERGIFRSLDGGASWTKVLGPDDNTGAMDVVLHPRDARIVYADLYAARATPWEGFADPLSARNGVFKSTDGGTTWRKVTAGLPDSSAGLGRVGLCVCPSDPSRMYAIVGTRREALGGLYRSDDAGESWHRVNGDARLSERDGDFNEVKVDPTNADIVYVANVMSWKSTDGGAHFEAFRGAPGGDDYHRFWIDPHNPRVILLAGDQGAVVTVNGGATWSSWYNQPTAQMFHVNADTRFPYWIYGGQQESGSAGVCSRGSDGAITMRDWRPVGIEEYGYAVPDPLHPNLIYGGKIGRFDWNTLQAEDVSPEPLRSGQFRAVRTMPIVFNPVDPRILYFGMNVVYETRDGAKTWRVISPNLAREAPKVPASLGAFAALDTEHGAHRGVVYALAPSFRRVNLLWAGTDDGQLWVTHDGGGAWRNVTPPTLTAWSKVSVLEASHADTLCAYAAINRIRCDDRRPHILRTRDGGVSWQEIVEGLPDDAPVNVVREDPLRRGLLFAGTERSVYVSFDDGDHWQSLRLNLPPSSMRDLAIHESDLIVATHGRSFWILDDYAPLREAAAAAAARGAHFFAPIPAYRVRHNVYTDTPPPPDEPAARNPPDGAILDYWLPRAATGAVTVEIRDSTGALVRRFSSTDPPSNDFADLAHVPPYWVRPAARVSAAAGAHRFVWDLRYPAPRAESHYFPLAAVIHDTAREPRGPLAVPGLYRVTLDADGALVTQDLRILPDPRCPTTLEGLRVQFAVGAGLAAGLDSVTTLSARLAALRTAGEAAAKQPVAPQAALDSLGATLARLTDGAAATRPGPRGPVTMNLARLAREYGSLYRDVYETDVAPRTEVRDALRDLDAARTDIARQWARHAATTLPWVNRALAQAGLPPVAAP